jgi:hypothetical protein
MIYGNDLPMVEQRIAVVYELWDLLSHRRRGRFDGADGLDMLAKQADAAAQLLAGLTPSESPPTAAPQPPTGPTRLQQITATVDSLTDDDWEETTPFVRKLLLCMKSRERADLSEVCPAVWGKDCAEVTENARATLVSKANKFLAKRSARWTLSKPCGESVLRWQ